MWPVVQLIDDVDQLEDVVNIVLRAAVDGAKRVTVTGKNSGHTQLAAAGDVSLRPIADHNRLLRRNLEVVQRALKRHGAGFSLSRVFERRYQVKHVMELKVTEPQPGLFPGRVRYNRQPDASLH